MSCAWAYDGDTYSWDTECGEKHQFTEDGPVENNHHFCPYCGGAIKLTVVNLILPPEEVPND